MGRSAASEALDCLNAYYEVTLSFPGALSLSLSTHDISPGPADFSTNISRIAAR
jgi:hypothetical protein